MGKFLSPQGESKPPPSEPSATAVCRRGFLNPKPKGALSEAGLQAPHLQDDEAGAAPQGCGGLAGVQGLLWLGTLLPLTTLLGANMPISFLGEIKISAGFCNPIPNPIWKNQAHAAWQPELRGLGLAGPGVTTGSHIGTGTAHFLSCYKVPWNASSPGGQSVGRPIRWREALLRPEASSASDLGCDFESIALFLSGPQFPHL